MTMMDQAMNDEMAAMRAEMRQMRAEAGLSVTREAPPLVMQDGKVGNLAVRYCWLDKWSLQHLSEQHGVRVYLDHTRDIYMEIPDDVGKPSRFYAGQWYVAFEDRAPMAMSEEDFEVHFGGQDQGEAKPKGKWTSPRAKWTSPRAKARNRPPDGAGHHGTGAGGGHPGGRLS